MSDDTNFAFLDELPTEVIGLVFNCFMAGQLNAMVMGPSGESVVDAFVGGHPNPNEAKMLVGLGLELYKRIEDKAKKGEARAKLTVV